MLKFRSMVTDAGSLGGASTAADDPRLTRVGKLLRRWKIDELPQFVNVLRGEMSLVGPRPQVADDVARYSTDERRLLSVRPGITDWSSVLFRNEGEILAGHADPDLAYDELIRPRKIALGLRYVERRSLRTDVRILWLTVRVVLQPSAAEALIAREVPSDPRAV
jgi:lipopolysaccharide/colanic/teichoic acid biosynthesis glycosyltransferase